MSRSDCSTSAGATPAFSSRSGLEVMSVPTMRRSPERTRSTGTAAAS